MGGHVRYACGAFRRRARRKRRDHYVADQDPAGAEELVLVAVGELVLEFAGERVVNNHLR